MVEMFSALLAQASYGDGVGFPNKGEPENTGFAVILIDVSKFMPLEQFKKSTDGYIRSIKGSRKAEGVSEIFLPGELEFKKLEQYMKTGYDVSDALGAELAGYGAQFGIIPEGAGFEALVNSL